MVCDVPFCDLLTLWPQVEPHIARALDRDGSGRCRPPDVLRFLLDGRVKLWVSWNGTSVEAAIVTETVDYPCLRELRIWLIGGRNLKAWATEARDMLEDFARASGCAVISGALRKGWIRIGGPGWAQTGVSFEKRL